MADGNQPGAQPGVRKDPGRAYNFLVSVQGVAQAHFAGVQGLGVTVTPILYREGGLRSAVWAVPGPIAFRPVTFLYGLTDSTELIDWLYKAVDGTVDRRNVSLSMLDDAATADVRRWDLLRAWPCEWSGAPLDSMGQELAIESLTVAYDRLELHRASPTSA